ncbi:MAG: hypothetical protein WCO02_15780 [Bacteroidota bacterium]
MEDWKNKKNGSEETCAILYRTITANDQRLERVYGNKKKGDLYSYSLAIVDGRVSLETDIYLKN